MVGVRGSVGNSDVPFLDEKGASGVGCAVRENPRPWEWREPSCLASFPSAPCPWPVASQLEGHCSQGPLDTLPGGLCPWCASPLWVRSWPSSPSVLGAHGWARACLPDPLQGAPWAEALPLWFRCDLTCPLGPSEPLPPILLSGVTDVGRGGGIRGGPPAVLGTRKPRAGGSPFDAYRLPLRRQGQRWPPSCSGTSLLRRVRCVGSTQGTGNPDRQDGEGLGCATCNPQQ